MLKMLKNLTRWGNISYLCKDLVFIRAVGNLNVVVAHRFSKRKLAPIKTTYMNNQKTTGKVICRQMRAGVKKQSFSKFLKKLPYAVVNMKNSEVWSCPEKSIEKAWKIYNACAHTNIGWKVFEISGLIRREAKIDCAPMELIVLFREEYYTILSNKLQGKC